MLIQKFLQNVKRTIIMLSKICMINLKSKKYQNLSSDIKPMFARIAVIQIFILRLRTYIPSGNTEMIGS